ncbi:uncharacterized protein F5147DRAFT_658385 [Suillus discolor]|uniref:Uncharacterized protein n=1 Tax=Suillus discolor TaxID=1912936 RepID=A0A9P7EUQ3_9AGAM|nr:uncharacterized protein F5147DRAFT_658385 [Suillus discolor]KAG2089636.1 hypothetical protein F5147DRAFT_658385 [Suillus discolor]
MDIHLQPTAPVYLYTPQLGRVLQVIPPPHPFVDFNGPECFILSAYLAHNYRQVSPIYCPDYMSVNSLDGVLPVVGTLAIPHHDETLFHTVYEKQFGDGDFLRAIDTQFCRPNGAGMIIPVWQCAVFSTDMPPLPTHFQPNNQLASVFAPPALLSVGGPALSGDFDYGYEQEDYTVASLGYAEDSVIPPQDTEMDDKLFGQLAPTVTTVFHDALRWTGINIAINNDDRSAIKATMNSTCWRCPIYLTKYFLYGAFWLGLGNPFTTTEKEQRVILTNCFLSAIAHDQTTLQELVNEPAWSVILQHAVAHFPKGTSIGWEVIHLLFSSTIENRLSDMCKVVRGCIRLDNFSGGGTVQEQEARIKALFDSFNSSDQQDIEQAIAELVELHMFGELMWMATFHTVIGLAEGTHDGRFADLFPQEVRGENLALAKCFAATLLTIYPTFMKTMVGLTFLRAPNVLPMDPKIQAPKVSAYEKRARTVADCSPIKQVEVNLPDLPYAEFTSIHYARMTEIIDDRCFL